MTALERMTSVLPLPYASDPRALVTRILDVCATEIEAAAEDIERMRRSHWIDRLYRGVDADKLAALVDVKRFHGEPTAIFLRRISVLVAARLQGAVGPRQLRQFVYDYIVAMERLLECTLVLGMRATPNEDAWSSIAGRPLYRPLQFVENPERVRRSRTLADRGGHVTHLCRWTETNRGLDDAPVTYRITGIGNGTTAMPSILNVTTRELIGYRGVIRPGRTLIIHSIAGQARATMEGRDVSARLYAIQPFGFAQPFVIETLAPNGPRLQRGRNELMYLAPAMLDQPAFDAVSLLVEDSELREAVLDASTFDHSLLPTAVAAHVEMRWSEHEPASFEIRIPRGVVTESTAMNRELRFAGMTRPPREEVADDLRDMLPQLRAAGVRAQVIFEPFRETQSQFDRFTEPGRVLLDPERAPTGRDRFGMGAIFDETPLALARLN
jgi:hypothetical protein